MQAVTTQVIKLQGDLAKMNEQLKKDNQAATAAKVQVDNAKALVNRWKGDIAFIAALKKLKQNLAAANEVINQKQAVVDQANQKLNSAQTVVDQAVQQKVVVENQAKAIEQQLQQLRGGK